MTDTIELTIDSKYDYVELAGAVTKNLSDLLEYDEDTASWIELAVREAVINAIKHGNRLSTEKVVDVRYTIGETEFTILVRDRGTGFDPSSLPDPLDPENLLNPSGRGIFYMRTFMDEVEYSRHPDGGTLVRMTKRRSVRENKGDSANNGQSDDQ